MFNRGISRVLEPLLSKGQKIFGYVKSVVVPPPVAWYNKSFWMKASAQADTLPQPPSSILWSSQRGDLQSLIQGLVVVDFHAATSLSSKCSLNLPIFLG